MDRCYSTEILHTRSSQSNYDITHDYYFGLLKLAFEKINFDVRLEPSSPKPHMREIQQMISGGQIDIYWAATNNQRERDLLPVRIPLNKGLLSFRVFIHQSDNYKKISSVETIDDLRMLKLCQKTHWVDSRIMENASLTLVLNSNYENMFYQTYASLCDAFPRRINEAGAELQARLGGLPDLYLYSNLILYYPMPMYFFVKKGDVRLSEKIKKGLELSIDDGSFDRYMMNHPSMKHLFPVKDWIDSRYIMIDNHLLPEGIDTNNARYWIIPPVSKAGLINKSGTVK